MSRVVDLFAGPGGWDVAAVELGLDPLGVEWAGEECGMVVCWKCAQAVVRVVDDGIGPGLVQSWMRLVRDREEEESNG